MNVRLLPIRSRVQMVFAAGALLLSSFGIAVASVNSQPVQPQVTSSQAAGAQTRTQAIGDSTTQSQHEANIAAPDISGLAS